MKHIPATPLPWEALGEMVNCGGDHPRIIAATFDGSAGNKQRDQQNASYAAHAANAYPRLIAALRATCQAIEASEGYEQERTGEYDAMPEPSRDAAETLLRDLGEL